MSCKRYQMAISAYLDGETEPQEWQRVLSHVESCPECAEVLTLFQDSTRVFKKNLTAREPEKNLWPEIAQQISTKQAASGRLPGNIWHLLKYLADVIFVHPPLPVRIVQTGLALLALVLLGNLIYQTSQTPVPGTAQLAERQALTPDDDSPVSQQTRLQRVAAQGLLQQYFEKTAVLLAEVKNSDVDLYPEEVSEFRRTSQTLLEETFLVKESLQRAEITSLQKVIEELEVLLLDVANLPDKPATGELDLLRAMIVQEDLLIKIEIYDRKALERMEMPGMGLAPVTSKKKNQI